MILFDEHESALVEQAAAACQQAIRLTLDEPSRPIGLLKRLGAALSGVARVRGRAAAAHTCCRAVAVDCRARVNRPKSKADKRGRQARPTIKRAS